MNWYLLWKYKHWIAIAVLSFSNLWMTAQLNKADSEKIEAVAKAVKPYVDAAKTYKEDLEKASAEYEKLKAKKQANTETITREVQKIIERPIYYNQCFDIDGLYSINSLITDNTR